MEVGADPAAMETAGEVADGALGVEGRLIAELLEHPGVVDAPAIAQQANAIAPQAPDSEPVTKPGERGLEQRMRDAHGGAAREAQGAAEGDGPVRSATLTAPRTSLRMAAASAPVASCGVHQLQAGVEAELRRDHGERQVARDRHVEVRTDLGLMAQHAAGDLRVAAGEVREVLLELGDVPLETAAQRHPPRQVLGEERRRRTPRTRRSRRSREPRPAPGSGSARRRRAAGGSR